MWRQHSVLIFKGWYAQEHILNLEDEDFALPQNVSIRLSIDAAPYPRRVEPSGTPLQESQNLYTLHLL